jgi:hypothetical protein
VFSHRIRVGHALATLAALALPLSSAQAAVLITRARRASARPEPGRSRLAAARQFAKLRIVGR